MSTLQEMLSIAGSFPKAEEMAKKMIDDGDKGIILDLQLLLSAQGKFDEVKELEKECDKYLPLNERRSFNKGWHYLKEGRFKEGMRSFYNSRPERFFGNPPMNTKKPLWDGTQDIKNKVVVLYGEGGLGDEIINVRFAKNIKNRGAKVICACNDGLMDLFSTVEGVDFVVPRSVSSSVLHDYWTPCMSSPLFCDCNYDNLPGDPYIFSTIKNEAWDMFLRTNKLKVGIRWAGNPKFEHEQFRKFPTEPLFDLVNIPNVQLYSFQRDNDMEKLPDNIIDLAPFIRTWDDTACALDRMDLVVTSCTSVAHLSAAMGKNTWIIVPIMPYYLWAVPGNTSAWYKTVTLFRQTKFGEWINPFANIKEELTKLAGK